MSRVEPDIGEAFQQILPAPGSLVVCDCVSVR